MFKKFLLFFSLTFAIFLNLNFANAGVNDGGFSGAKNLLESTAGTSGAGYVKVDLPTMVGQIIKACLGFIGIIFLVLSVYSGYQWMTSGGSAAGTKEAQERLKNAVIGLIIIVASYSLTDFIITKVFEIGGQQ